jgi:type IV pilus assembly protein PilV
MLNIYAYSLKNQAGGLLIESLIAMMIFSVGIVGLINLQTFANKTAAEAIYRGEAAMLADQLIRQLWASDRSNAATVIANFNDPSGANYQNWAWRGTTSTGAAGSGTTTAPANGTVYQMLPNAASMPPTIQIDSLGSPSPSCVGAVPPCPSNYRIVITVFWRAPSDKSTDPFNNFVATAHIGGG